MIRQHALVLCALMFFNALASAQEPKGDYVKVEIKGTLQTGIAAIGGETTGVQIRSGGVAWEVDPGKKYRADIAKLNKKKVIIKGMLTVKRGVEIRSRTILSVTSLKVVKE